MRRDDSSPPTTSSSPENNVPSQAPSGLPQPVPSSLPLSDQAVYPLLHLLPATAQSPSPLAAIYPLVPTSLLPQPPMLIPQGPLYMAPATQTQSSRPISPPATLYQRIQMQIAVQPPSKTVYQRILKPFPSVYLIVPAANDQASGGQDLLSLLYEALNAKTHEEGIFVEVDVIRHDNGDALERSIDGQTTARLEKSGWNTGVYTATFKKIKLLTTSQQKSGAKFCLSFRLKCSSLNLGAMADMVVISNPIEVFSHSQYLGKSEEEARARSAPGALKYAENPAGLHLKLMESIHAFKELGGSPETLINYITSIYSQTNPLPSSMLAIPPQPTAPLILDRRVITQPQAEHPLAQLLARNMMGTDLQFSTARTDAANPLARFLIPNHGLGHPHNLSSEDRSGHSQRTTLPAHAPSPDHAGQSSQFASLPSIASLLASTLAEYSGSGDLAPATTTSISASPKHGRRQVRSSSFSGPSTPLHALSEAALDEGRLSAKRKEREKPNKSPSKKTNGGDQGEEEGDEDDEDWTPTKPKRRRASSE